MTSITIKAQDADAYKKEGNLKFATSKYEEAIELYTKGLELDSENHILYGNRAAACLKMERFDNALSDAQMSVQLEPKWVKGYHRAASAYVALGRLNEAIEQYEKALQINPDDKSLKRLLKTTRSKLKTKNIKNIPPNGNPRSRKKGNKKKKGKKIKNARITKLDQEKSDLEREIEKIRAEMAAAAKVAEDARATVDREMALYSKAKTAHEKVKKQEDEAKLNMEKAMENLQKGGLDGQGAGLDNDNEMKEDGDGAAAAVDDHDNNKTSAPDYGKKSYWEKRYSGEDGNADLHVDDWYLKFSDLEKYLTNIPRGDKPALDVGCGTSKLCEELIYEGKFKNVYGVDFSYNAINTMKDKDEIEGLSYMVMDATKMHFKDEFFSCAFDKGTIDAVMSGKTGLQMVKSILTEVYRVLAPKGVFIVVSSIPQLIYLGMLESARCDWKIEYYELKTKEEEETPTTTNDDNPFGMMSMWIYTLTKN